MRIEFAVIPFLALAALTLPAMADSHAKTTQTSITPEVERMAGHETDTYRYGTILGAVRGSTPQNCEILCSQNGACSTWTYLSATFESGPICEIKATIGRQIYRPGAISGIAFKYQPGSPTPPLPAKTVPIAGPVKQPVLRTVKTPPPGVELMGGPETPAPVPQTHQLDAAENHPSQRVSAHVSKAESIPARRGEKHPEMRKAPASPPGPEQTRQRPQFRMTSAPIIEPAPAMPSSPSSQAPEPVQTRPVHAPTAGRRPWTERKSGETGYSVSGMDYVPGDEEATAGYLNEYLTGR